MRRILTAAVALAFAATVAIASPAAAEQTTKRCKDWTGNLTQTKYYLCLTVYWRDLGGHHGIAVDDMWAEISGGPWENNAFECDALRVWNENDIVKWRRDGSPCDMTNADAHFEFQPNFPDGLVMPDTDTASVSLAGWPHFNHNGDPDRMVLTINITDHDGQ
jgi:hypothetical protein